MERRELLFQAYSELQAARLLVRHIRNARAAKDGRYEVAFTRLMREAHTTARRLLRRAKETTCTH
jgi:hypothetical protein